MNNSVYLNSNECAVAESFLNAFKNFDIEALDKARGPTSVMYADPDFQDFARALTFMGSNHMRMPSEAAPSIVYEQKAGPTISRDQSLDSGADALQASLQSMHIPADGDDDSNNLESLGADEDGGDSMPAGDDDDDINLC